MEARGTRAVTLGPRSKRHRARFPRIPNYYVTVDSMFLRLGARFRVYFTYIRCRDREISEEASGFFPAFFSGRSYILWGNVG